MSENDKKAESKRIFIIRTSKSAKLMVAYEKAMRDLNAFFEMKWVRNRPKIFLADKNTLKDACHAGWPTWATGWAEFPNVLMLSKGGFTPEQKMLMVHEVAHLFFLMCAKISLDNTQVFPIWLWEGVSMFVSGQILRRSMTRPIKFGDFLNYYDRHTVPGRVQPTVYWESGFVVEFLVKKYGKQKLLELIKSIKQANTEELFAKRFKGLYGFELSYDEFNKRIE